MVSCPSIDSRAAAQASYLESLSIWSSESATNVETKSLFQHAPTKATERIMQQSWLQPVFSTDDPWATLPTWAGHWTSLNYPAQACIPPINSAATALSSCVTGPLQNPAHFRHPVQQPVRPQVSQILWVQTATSQVQATARTPSTPSPRNGLSASNALSARWLRAPGEEEVEEKKGHEDTCCWLLDSVTSKKFFEFFLKRVFKEANCGNQWESSWDECSKYSQGWVAKDWLPRLVVCSIS